MVELKRMPYAMAAYKTYRRPANDNAGCVSMDDALLKDDRSGYSHDRFFSMAESMSRTGLDPFQISIGLLRGRIRYCRLQWRDREVFGIPGGILEELH